MSRPLVVDASVAFKWFVPEEGQDAALSLLARPDRLIAPELLLAEVSNIAWKARAQGRITPTQARELLGRVEEPFDEIVSMRPHFGLAHELGAAFHRPIYDFVYVALAEDRDGVLVTADVRLGRLLVGTRWASRVLTLAELDGAPRS